MQFYVSVQTYPALYNIFGSTRACKSLPFLITNTHLASHHYHHAPDDVYKVQQSSFSVVPRPTVRGLEVQKPQTYVLVPISEPYPQGSPMQEYRPHQFPYP